MHRKFSSLKKYFGFYDHKYHCVLLYCVIYLDFVQDVTMLVSTAVTVTFLVQQTVKIVRVTYKVERVSLVNLDGLIYIVIEVRP